MKTNAMEAEENARRGFQTHLNGDRCHCGGYKWPGFCFCLSCLERLPARARRMLYGKGGDAYRLAYDAARQALTQCEPTAIKEAAHGA